MRVVTIMRLRIRLSRMLAAGTALALASGCSRSEDTPETTEANGSTLRVAFVPQRDRETRSRNAYRVLGRYIEHRLDRPVKVIELTDVTAALEGLRADKLDLCSFSPWPFLLAEQKAGAEALLVTGGPSGFPVDYHTVFIAHPDTGLRTMDDVKARSRELVFSFEEPVSTSGHLVPRAYMHDLGIDPEADFKQVLFSPDSTVSILSIKARRIDVAAVSNTTLRRSLANGRIAPGDIVELCETPPVLSNVLCVRRELPEDLKAGLRRALLELPAASPGEWAQVARMYSNPVAKYLPATDAIIQPYRDMIRNVPGLQAGL
ncbi:MAG: phosphate/phosphite/phosphonate ABC transporter substrate-binding protein [Opitutaceae bacterium]